MNEYHQQEGGKFGSFLLGALVATGVGMYYFFGSKRGRRNRQKVDWWIEDMKDEITEKAKKIKDITQDKFDDIVKTVSEKYSKYKDIAEDELENIKKEMKKEWKKAQEEEEED